LCIIAITLYFLIKVNRAEDLGHIRLLETEETHTNLIDLNSIINSVSPHYFFRKYLLTHYPEQLAYLEMVKTWNIYSDKREDIQ
jgi:hypothetical protein